MRVMHEVKGCADCPMLGSRDGWSCCQHPMTDKEVQFNIEQPAPAWCPLRAGELLLKLRTK